VLIADDPNEIVSKYTYDYDNLWRPTSVIRRSATASTARRPAITTRRAWAEAWAAPTGARAPAFACWPILNRPSGAATR
jgi:hypothetical protein